MKFSTTLAATSSLVASAYAAPASRAARSLISRAPGQGSWMTLNSTLNLQSSDSQGAAYFITNDPTGNYIVASDINADGSLTLATAMSTGGLGQHGNVTGADPLYSQGAIVVNSAKNLLATVNAGSNTVSLFSIDPSTPTSLTALGAPVASGGEFPQSVAFSEAGDKLCALNGGARDGVQCFWVNATLGLVPITGGYKPININQTTPATGIPGTASHVIFSKDQKSVYAAAKGNPATGAKGFIAAFDLGEDGLGEEYRLGMPAGGNIPFSMGYIPGRDDGSLLVTDIATGFNILDFSKGVPNALAQSASRAVTIAGERAVCWNAFSNKTGSFYLSDFLTGIVTEVRVDAATLNTTQLAQYDTQGDAGLIDLQVATVGDKDYLYVVEGTAAGIQVFSLDAPGKATRLQSVDLKGPASAVGLPLEGINIQGLAVFLKQ